MTQQYNNTQTNMEFPLGPWMVIKEFMIPTIPTRHRQMMKSTLDRIGRNKDWYTELLEYQAMGVAFWSVDGRDVIHDHANGRYPDLLEAVMDLMVGEIEDRYTDMSTLMTTLDLDEEDDKSLCNKLFNLWPDQPEMIEMFKDNHGVIQNQIVTDFNRLMMVYKRLYCSEIMSNHMRQFGLDDERDDTELYDEVSIVMPKCCPLWYEYARICKNMC